MSKLETAKKLLKKRYYTADSLARALKVSRMSAYRYINDLILEGKGPKKGFRVKEIRQGGRGPQSNAYRLR